MRLNVKENLRPIGPEEELENLAASLSSPDISPLSTDALNTTYTPLNTDSSSSTSEPDFNTNKPPSQCCFEIFYNARYIHLTANNIFDNLKNISETFESPQEMPYGLVEQMVCFGQHMRNSIFSAKKAVVDALKAEEDIRKGQCVEDGWEDMKIADHLVKQNTREIDALLIECKDLVEKLGQSWIEDKSSIVGGGHPQKFEDSVMNGKSVSIPMLADS